MRALHFVKTSVGASWAWREVRELVVRGVDVHVALPPGGPMVERYRQVGACVHPMEADLPLSRPARLPAAIAAVRDVVSTVAPDIIHTHAVGSAMLVRTALRRRSGVPRVFQVPGPLHLEAPHTRLAELGTATTDDLWIATCEHTRRLYLRAGIRPDRVWMSYYGTDVDAYTATGASGRLRAELGVGPATAVVGMVAYMYAPKRLLLQRRGLKGHEDLIDAISLLRHRGLDLVGVFIGGPWDGADEYADRLRAYGIAKCGSAARFLGTRSDVAALYPDLDVVVHPSHSENVGGAVESLLMGVPTVATDVGGMPELVVDGRTGWVVPARSPRSIAHAITDVLADKAEARARAARGRGLAARLFDVRSTAAQVHDVYRQVLVAGARNVT